MTKRILYLVVCSVLCTYCQDVKIFFIQLTVHTKGKGGGRITGRKVNHLTWYDNLLTWSISKDSGFERMESEMGDESHMAYDFIVEDIHRRFTYK